MKIQRPKFLYMLSCAIALSYASSSWSGAPGARTSGTLHLLQHQIKGKITDPTGAPLEGASIIIKGQRGGSVSDVLGNFNLAAADSDVLVVTYVGYETRELTVAGDTAVEVVLQPSGTGLEEVVVTALGIEKEKRRVGYAVQEVKGE